MNKKRDRLEVIHDMLQALQDKGHGVKPTHIMYKSNLSHQMLKDYLPELLEKGFIIECIEKKGKKTYRLAAKGFNFLKDYSMIKGFVDSYGLD
ncbi:MAG: winged helix-turn-helix domain-containing protein [archaeon]